jgi:hypothetical protein
VNESLEKFLCSMQSPGEAERNLSFACLCSDAYLHGMAPAPVDRGLLALSKAVQAGVGEVALWGDERASRLSFEQQNIPLGPGAFSQILRRGALAPTVLRVNGQQLLSGFSRPLFREEIKQAGDLLGGFIDILPAGSRGLVELVDRGISFSLGALFPATRAILSVTPLKGAPWPSRLVLNSAIHQVIGEVWAQIQQTEDRLICQNKSLPPQLVERLKQALRKRRNP